jgi:alpha-beta hydrolase superfamily lysophospholipase
MTLSQEAVSLRSLDDNLAATFFVPGEDKPMPALIVCHGAGEFKEHYYELCEVLAVRGVATLAVDMHGHGQSAGTRFNVDMRQWVADIQAAIDFLLKDPRIDGQRIAAFGLSSGGTAILEAALVDPRLKSLVALDATVRNSLSWPLSLMLKTFLWLGKLTKWITRRDLRVPLAKLGDFKVASDPEINRQLQSDPRAVAAFLSFPFPGAAEAFFVDTLKRVSGIKVPTLVLWGEDDTIDPPETARLLYAALSCHKQLHIIPGNGHLGHLDRNREQVFALTADWVLKTLL